MSTNGASDSGSSRPSGVPSGGPVHGSAMRKHLLLLISACRSTPCVLCLTSVWERQTFRLHRHIVCVAQMAPALAAVGPSASGNGLEQRFSFRSRGTMPTGHRIWMQARSLPEIAPPLPPPPPPHPPPPFLPTPLCARVRHMCMPPRTGRY